MADRDSKKYYWLKLQKDFFKRHDIRIVESMPNGKDYVIFYLKLLCESTSHEGALRFNKEIPYNDEMLATITNTNIDIVRSAIKLFSNLKMMEMLDDGTLFMNQVAEMIGSETGSARRKREYRENVKQIGTMSQNCPLELEKDIELEKESEKEKDKEKESEKDKKIQLLSLQESWFTTFWKEYPKKVDKKNTKAKFMKVCKTEEKFKEIMNGLKTTEIPKAKDKGKQYVPNPSTWINGERWNDEPYQPKKEKQIWF